MFNLFDIWRAPPVTLTLLDELNVPKPHLYSGPWIIGGAAIKFQKTGDFQNCRDIDYFFKSNAQYNRFKSRFKRLKNAKYDWEQDAGYSGAKNFTLTVAGHTFNLIGFNFAKTAEITADSFDFTICQIWTDGHTINCSKLTKEHLENRILSFTNLERTTFQLKHENNKKIEDRIRKYKKKGYEPDDQMIQFILKYL